MVTVTMTVFMRFERFIPLSTSTVSSTTAATAKGTWSASPQPIRCRRYPENPRAAVAAEAVLAHKNIHPAMKPSQGVR
jgi:hypothetical protein